MTPEKFIGPYIEFLKADEDIAFHEHCFWVRGTNESYRLPEEENLVFEGRFGLLRRWISLYKEVRRADKVILHGLFRYAWLTVIAIQPGALKKCAWVIWGGDLYREGESDGNLLSSVRGFLRRFSIKRFGYLVTYIPGDIAFARREYSATGLHIECLCYPSNLFSDPDEAVYTDGKLNILLGNSAHFANRHLELLNELSVFSEEDISIYTPLSYGSRAYADEVRGEGDMIFGERFVPLLEFMPIEEYLKLLGKIDIAIFGHKRQQAMGTTIALLGMGKKVFMRSDVPQYDLLTGMGVEIFDVTSVDLTPLPDEVADRNRHIIREQFSAERFRKQLERLFK